MTALHRFVVERYGRLDILVNNAGVAVEKTVVETTDEDWDQVMGANALGVFLCCRALIPLLRDGGGGAIVNIGSISGFHADPAMALYNASKGFVHGLTRSIAVDHGPEGIRCNAVCPGWILTGMADHGSAPCERRIFQYLVNRHRTNSRKICGSENIHFTQTIDVNPFDSTAGYQNLFQYRSF